MPTKTIKVVIGGNEAPVTQKLVRPSAFQTCLMLTKVDRSLRGLVTKQLKPFKLTMTQWLLLGVVASADTSGISISNTAKSLNVTMSQVTGISTQLVTAHLLRQKRTQRSDHRSRYLLLTARGRVILEDVEESVNKALIYWFQAIPENQLVFYRRVNEQLAKNPKS